VLEQLAIRAGQQLRLRPGARAPQRIRLRLAAAFGDRLGEVGAQDGRPEPEDDLELEADILPTSEQVADEDDRGQHGHDLEHEHDRIADQRARIELDESRTGRRQHDLGIEQRRGRRSLADV
jgi:hypothetical protein